MICALSGPQFSYQKSIKTLYCKIEQQRTLPLLTVKILREYHFKALMMLMVHQEKYLEPRAS